MIGSRHASFVAAGLATALFAAATLAFGALHEGYRHAELPLGLLGARGVRQAAAFNALGFVLPGALMTWVAWRLRERAPAGLGFDARIGLRLAFLSALAFAAQGLLPLDPGDLDARASKLHASAWMLWWIAFLAGTALLSVWALRAPRPGTLARLVHPLAAVGVLLCLLWGGAAAQRAAFALWFGWGLLCAAAASRDAASAPGSSPPAGR